MSVPALVAIGALGLAHIAARYAGPLWLAGVLKPLPIVLLVVLVATGDGTAGGRFRDCVAVGLVCSLVGDVSLVFPKGFRAGLASFFVAHLLYIAAFAPGGGWSANVWLVLLPFAAAAVGMLVFLWPHVGRERPAVAAYVAVLALMAWRAVVRAPGVPAPGGVLAALGAVVFMVSDSLLATDRFVRPFRAAEGAVMVTYYLAQTLIAGSAIV